MRHYSPDFCPFFCHLPSLAVVFLVMPFLLLIGGCSAEPEAAVLSVHTWKPDSDPYNAAAGDDGIRVDGHSSEPPADKLGVSAVPQFPGVAAGGAQRVPVLKHGLQ